MSTKIQINSLEALERLIGNDTELEIEIRNSIVQEFTKKHLKVIANENVNKHISDFNREIQDVAGDTLGSYVKDPKCSWRQIYLINETVKKEIETAARNQSAVIINAEIAKLIEHETESAFEKIKVIINERVDSLTEVYIKDMVAEKLEKIKQEICDESTSMRSGLH